ncbi:hypothetical protein NDU88_002492 [Pleurodeles waltl]|uniref:Uncharacterized protein n=1 Tax=Pleurodeles waltl TaxID=8319 RepID=A0AAV7W2J0_PLEWA|nr:hypothetical protein NDU88_002492 [Pleurodeles waltl]
MKRPSRVVRHLRACALRRLELSELRRSRRLASAGSGWIIRGGLPPLGGRGPRRPDWAAALAALTAFAALTAPVTRACAGGAALSLEVGEPAVGCIREEDGPPRVGRETSAGRRCPPLTHRWCRGDWRSGTEEHLEERGVVGSLGWPGGPADMCRAA